MRAFEEIGEQISMLERRAMEAERDTSTAMSPPSSPTRSASSSECRITGVQPFGFFATVEDLGGDGLVLAADAWHRNISATTRRRGSSSATRAARPIASASG